MFNRNFLLGFVSGALAGVAGYRLYEQNGGQLQNLIHGALSPDSDIVTPVTSAQPKLEELVSQKERLEDLIAERKISANQ